MPVKVRGSVFLSVRQMKWQDVTCLLVFCSDLSEKALT